MDVFLMIRRKKQTIFTDCKDSMTIGDLKKIIEGIIKTDPKHMQLQKEGQILEDDKNLQSCGLTPTSAKAQSPAAITLVLRNPIDEKFEVPEVTPYSSPPDLPEVMKNQEGTVQEGSA